MFSAVKTTILLGDGISMTSTTGAAQWEEVFTLEALKVVHDLVNLDQVASKASHL